MVQQILTNLIEIWRRKEENSYFSTSSKHNAIMSGSWILSPYWRAREVHAFRFIRTWTFFLNGGFREVHDGVQGTSCHTCIYMPYELYTFIYYTKAEILRDDISVRCLYPLTLVYKIEEELFIILASYSISNSYKATYNQWPQSHEDKLCFLACYNLHLYIHMKWL